MQSAELSRTPSVRLLLMAFAAGIGGSFQCGFNFSLINIPTKEVQAFINSTWQARYGQPVSDSTLTLLWAVIASVFAVGGLVGALVARPMALLMGRKAGLLANNAFAIIAVLLMGVSEVATSFELIIIGRFLIGVNCGAGLGLHPMYLAESAPQHQRGALAMTTSMFLTVGILVGQIVGLRQVLGGSPLWPVVLALPALPAIVQLLVLPWFPESPRYLLITRKKPKEALEALRWLRRRSVSLQSVKLELEAMGAEESHTASGVARTGMLGVLRERSTRRQLVVVVTLNITQQLSGINAIYFYSTYIFKEAEITEDHIPYVTLGTGAAEILTAVTCGMIIDWLGRRPLLIAGYSLMGLCCILITIGLALQKGIPALSYFSIAIVFAYILSFGIGPGGILNVLPAELFSHHARPAAYSIAGCVNWLSFFVIGIIFPFLVKATGPYCFLLFLANSVAGVLLVCCLLPETRNCSFLEVSELFDARRSSCYGTQGTAATNGDSRAGSHFCILPEAGLCRTSVPTAEEGGEDPGLPVWGGGGGLSAGGFEASDGHPFEGNLHHPSRHWRRLCRHWRRLCLHKLEGAWVWFLTPWGAGGGRVFLAWIFFVLPPTLFYVGFLWFPPVANYPLGATGIDQTACWDRVTCKLLSWPNTAAASRTNVAPPLLGKT